MIKKQLSRRSFLRGTGAAAAGSGLGLGLRAGTVAAGSRDDAGTGSVFQHGVCSGDPTQTSVILWTRLTPASVPGRGDERRSLPVRYEVALDQDLSQLVMQDQVVATPDNDYCVKVDVQGLEPGQHYWYRFSYGNGDNSDTARTNTLPADPQALRFAIVSCSSYLHGYFNVYRSLATRDWGEAGEPVAVLHVGDYIYEYGTGEYGTAREADPSNEIRSLSDYRDRHAQYKQDEDLAALHLMYPFITIWDDHETADNAWSGGATQHDDESDGIAWEERKNNGRQAYFEWMPIRQVGDPDSRDPDERYAIYRHFSFGSLADLTMLDTRIHRTHYEAGNPLVWIGHAEPPSWASPEERDKIYDESRSLLGRAQEQWLYGEGTEPGVLGSSGATWNIIGQQIMVGQLKLVGVPNTPAELTVREGIAVNTDGWDGWVPSRNKLYDAIEAINARDGNVVVLTGDIHTSWAMDITRDPNNPAHYDPLSGRGSIAVEYVCPSVTSPGLPELAPAQDGIRAMNPHMKYIDLERHGYIVLDVDKEKVTGTWWYIDSIDEPNATGEKAGPAFYVMAATADEPRYLQREGVPLPEASGHEHRFE